MSLCRLIKVFNNPKHEPVASNRKELGVATGKPRNLEVPGDDITICGMPISIHRVLSEVMIYTSYPPSGKACIDARYGDARPPVHPLDVREYVDTVVQFIKETKLS